jgi:cysteinyl-tRNA synthetase
MLVHDTLSAAKVELVTREPGRVALYVCGPTVYDVRLPGSTVVGYGHRLRA